MMKVWAFSIVLLAALAPGCSSGPKYVSADAFQSAYRASKTQTLDHYSYVGETNGFVYIRRTSVGLSSGAPNEQVFFTETEGLSPGFLEAFRKEPSVEPVAAPNERH